MENPWEVLKEASLLIRKWKIEEAKLIYEEVYKSLDRENIAMWNEYLGIYISCLLWLWEIFMKSNKLEKSLQYYLEWFELTKWNDFNIAFNLWVVYSNLNNIKESEKYLNIAKNIEPNNPNLLNFLSIMNNVLWKEDNQNTTINQSFKEKIQKMIKQVSKK